MFRWWSIFLILTIPLFFINNFAIAKHTWEKPGCHKVGHTKKVSVPGCVEFTFTTNACRGYCASWAVPSVPQLNSNLPVTSVGQCCNMIDTEEVEANVLCAHGMRKLKFLSAKSCECYHCKKN